MSNVLTISLLTSSALYLSAWVIMFKKANPRQAHKTQISLSLITAGICFQALATLVLINTEAGINLNLPNTLLFATFISIVLLVLAFNRRSVYYLVLIFLPAGIITNVLPLIWQTSYHPQPLALGVIAHIFTSITAFSLLLVAVVQATLLFIQNHKLKAHQTGGFLALLPPLQTMETLLFEILTLGTIALSISMVTGFVFLEDLFEQKVAHKTVFSIIAWLIFSGLLFARRQLGIRGTKAVKAALTGYALLFLGFIGSKWVLEIILTQ